MRLAVLDSEIMMCLPKFFRQRQGLSILSRAYEAEFYEREQAALIADFNFDIPRHVSIVSLDC